RAEIGARQQRHFGDDVEAPHAAGGHQGDVGHLGGIGVVVDVGVGQRQSMVGQQQNVHGGVGAHARLLADHFINELQVVTVRTDRTADHAVGVAQPHHHGTDQGQATAHFHACHFLGDAAATHQLPVGGPVAVEALIVVGVGDFVVLVETQAQTEFLDAVGD